MAEGQLTVRDSILSLFLDAVLVITAVMLTSRGA
jgi:hypothetical protein